MTKMWMAAALACVAVECSAATPLTITQTQYSSIFSPTNYRNTRVNGGTQTRVNEVRKVLEFNGFQPSLGILTGATLSATSANPELVSYVENKFYAGGAAATTTMTSTTQATAAFTTSGLLTNPTDMSSVYQRTCTGSCESTNDQLWDVDLSASFSQAGLATAARNATNRYGVTFSQTSTFTSNGPVNGGSVGAGYFVALTSTLTYNYLKHGQAALGIDGSKSLTLDFGDLQLGSGPASKLFALYNFGDANTASLDLDSISAADGFSVGLTPTAELVMGGGFKVSNVTFDPTQAGRVNKTIILQMSDADLGVGMQSTALTINLLANVLAPVPEPDEWAMMVAGLCVVGAAARRRRKG